MSTAELSKYRLSSPKEPSDKMLESLMEQVTEQVCKRAVTANTKFFSSLGHLVAARLAGSNPLGRIHSEKNLRSSTKK